MSIVLNTTSSGYNLSAINTNFATIQEYINTNVLNRAGSTSGESTMHRALDMDSNPILNLPAPVSNLSPVRLVDLATIASDNSGLVLRSDLADASKGDVLVAVKQPYTGSVVRTQHDKNAEHVSVLDFGADNTGNTESLSVFNLAASVSGFVVIPSGTYLLSSATNSATWLVHPGVTLLGQANVGTAGGGVPNFSYLTGRVYNYSAGGQIGLKMGGSGSWLTGSFRDPIEYISETVSIAKNGGYGVVGASRASDDPTPNMNTIGVGAFGYNDYATAPNPVWASYMEGRRETGTGPLFGIELDFVNSGYNFIETPINIIDPYSATSPVIGIRLSSGGGVGGNPSSTAMDISPNGSTWNAGVLFREGSLTDGKAINMPAAYGTYFYDNSGNISGVRNGTGEDLTVVSSTPVSCVTDTYRKNNNTGTTVTGDRLYRANYAHFPAGTSVVGASYTVTQVSGNRVGIQLVSNNDDGVPVGLMINSASNNSVTPNLDNSVTSGSSAFRWSAVYSVNGTIQTSDATLKDFIDIEESEVVIGKALSKLFRKYKWKSGDTKIHFGVSAQEVRNTFSDKGLDALDYGVLHYEDGVYGVNYTELQNFVMMALFSNLEV